MTRPAQRAGAVSRPGRHLKRCGSPMVASPEFCVISRLLTDRVDVPKDGQRADEPTTALRISCRLFAWSRGECREARDQQLGERARPVADGVLLGRIDLAERLPAAARHEHRIVAKTLVAARRPDRRAVDAADEGLGVSIRPGEAQCGDEPCAPVRGVAHLLVHPRHRGGKVLGCACPARRIHPGRAVQRGDAEAGIVRQRRQAARPRSRQRLDARVADEVRCVLRRFRQAQRTRRDHRNGVRAQQIGEFRELAGIVAGQDKPRAAGEPARHHVAPTASRCATNSAATPWRARPSIARNCASLNALRSAVPWISTMPPLSVSTKLASASAEESSA